MPIKEIRYHREEDLDPQREILRGYYREIIHQYGINCSYFRKDLRHYESPSGNTVNYAYGEQTTASYYLSGGMVVYMEMEGDSMLLNKFGIETDGDASCYILIDDFTEQYRDTIGTEQLHIQNNPIEMCAHNWSLPIYSDVISPGLTGYVSACINLYEDNPTSGYTSGISLLQFERTPDVMNPYTKSSPKYTEQATSGILSAFYEGTVDCSGYGLFTGSISGDLIYKSAPAENAGPNWQIAPQVGDFFRIQFHDGINNEEYEITNLTDKDLMTDGLNPLLDRYIWKMNVVRRDPSYEQVVGDDQEEPWTVNKDEQNDWHEDEANEIFDYDVESPEPGIDDENSDEIYGDYGKAIYGM